MEIKPNFFEKFWYIFVGLAVFFILTLTSLWFFNQKALKEQTASKQLKTTAAFQQETSIETTIEPQTPIETDNQILQLENQSSSDEIEEIEKDLNNTDFSNIDREADAIDQELNNP